MVRQFTAIVGWTDGDLGQTAARSSLFFARSLNVYNIGEIAVCLTHAAWQTVQDEHDYQVSEAQRR